MMNRPWSAHVDMYRKIPADFMEGTRRGSILSYVSLFVMVLLFLLETKAYFSTRLVADLALDKTDDPRIRLNFNITMTDLKCEWAVIDVVSVLGTDQNVTAHVTKWNVDGAGVRKGYKGRNRNQKDIDLYDETVTDTLEDLHKNGEDAVSLDPETLELYREEHEYLFVDFYASWCSHCHDLAPTWEALAEVMIDAAQSSGRVPAHQDDYSEEDYDTATKVQLPVVIAKLDCVSYPHVCNQEQHIRAYPTLRLFVDGAPWRGGDYSGHRTIIEMAEWLYYVEEQHKELLGAEGAFGDRIRKLHKLHEQARERLENREEEEKKWHNANMHQKRRLYHEWKEDEHPGCQLSGHLLLDRVPGNFHILARSQNHDLAPHMTNVSHMVNSLSIGDPMASIQIETGKARLPPEVKGKIRPMDGNVYTTKNLHESYHHYLKVVSTKADGLQIGRRAIRTYQILPNSQLAYYRTDVVPEARFSYDLSPIAVTYRSKSRHWYDYVTSIMAIIGGVFTVVGMIESGIDSTVRTLKRRSRGF